MGSQDPSDGENFDGISFLIRQKFLVYFFNRSIEQGR